MTNNKALRFIYGYPDDRFKFTTSYIRDQSFKVLTNECNHPYSIAIHPGINGNPQGSIDDVLWYSEGRQEM